MVQGEIEIYEENENQEEMLEEQEMHEQDISDEEPEEEKGPIASRTISQLEQPISSRTRNKTMDVASFADMKCGNNIQEWLEDAAFVTGTMCDPNDIKKPTTLDDYLGVQVIKSKDKNGAWLGQPTIIDALTKKIGKKWKTKSNFNTRNTRVHRSKTE